MSSSQTDSSDDSAGKVAALSEDEDEDDADSASNDDSQADTSGSLQSASARATGTETEDSADDVDDSEDSSEGEDSSRSNSIGGGLAAADDSDASSDDSFTDGLATATVTHTVTGATGAAAITSIVMPTVTVPRVPAFKLHPWQPQTSLSSVDLRPPEEKLEEARRLAAMCVNSHQVETRTHYLVRAVSLSTLLHGDGHPLTASLRRQLAESYLERHGCHAQAIQHAKEALTRLRNSRDVESEVPNLPGLRPNDVEPGKDEDVTAVPTGVADTMTSSDDGQATRESPDIGYEEFRCLLCIGQAQANQSKFQPASRTLDEADRLHRHFVQTTGRCDVSDVIAVATARARVLRSLRKVDQAVAVLRKGASYCGQLSSGDADGGAVHHIEFFMEMSTVFSSASRWSEALGVLQQARQLLRERSRASEKLADCEIAIARVLMKDSACEGSPEAHLKRALKILHHLHSMEDSRALEVQEDLARLMVQRSEHQGAVDLLKEVIHIKQKAYSDYSVEVGKSYQLLGTLYLAAGNIPDAITNLNKAHSLLSSLLGGSTKHVKQLTQLIAMLSSSQKSAGGRNARRFAV